ncbi:MAG TPA: DNA (cytosine-5-)-methyltransferase [Cyclobacteriaceae bacterium]|nr:DNA (cytosine-5-)-methyltransferase [Cyclobacteriaceae bacterium]MCB9236315.1 DNA (cytosine-5-)-methyltransferase [Flammeovirgaceae bacterium]MCB0500637.1 DNA (cytosine-5-)-methyltransferase [Cyclobacteriaceae bacterium]MCO5272750.1 DNA (cytosine-5-)-methyltransferase [Cyclobacteriaceae bacterium]MCW5902189.1 DNA (cytosine-5-)-methyltransferase [Cyclobacteriaceae bacterium]
MKEYYTLSEVADLLGKSKETLRRWDHNGKLTAVRDPMSNYRVYRKEQLKVFDELDFLFNPSDNGNKAIPDHNYTVLELFAGAGGLAIGLDKAGLKCVALNEIDHWAAETLRKNRPHWNVLEGDVKDLSFHHLRNQVDVVTGGFPCQAFSYAGKKLGLNDARGTLFYEFARVVEETKPLICVGENVRGLLNHDSGRTIEGMKSILEEIGYRPLEPRILKAIFYNVPQKRERLILVGVRKDIEVGFGFPKPYKKIHTLRDALKAGGLYATDVPVSEGGRYPVGKQAILEKVPPGGYWRDLPIDLQKKYMQKSFYLEGGKTGMARRMNWEEPSLTLTCSPSQKQTERCHPDETRPFTVREYARIQTFPDDWEFAGPVSSRYRQIGNAVPVNLAREVGYSLVKFLNDTYQRYGFFEKEVDAHPVKKKLVQ